MNATTRNTRLFIGAAAFLALSASPCGASLVKMGFHKDSMTVDMDVVTENFDRFRKLHTLEMRKLQTTEIFQFGDGTTIELDKFENDHIHEEGEDHDHDLDQSDSIAQAVEDAIENGDPIVLPSLPNGDPIVLPSIPTLDQNETSTTGDDEEQDEEVDFPWIPEIVKVQNQLQQEQEQQQADQEAANNNASNNNAVAATDPPIMETGPRGGIAGLSPYNQPTEISFMIIMEDFRYANGIESMDDITIGTKFGFTGRITTKAEDLGKASGSCTVTSAIEKELSYCDIYQKIDTDNYGGFGTVITAGTADEVGGRYLVTGTGGSLQSTSQGYGMIQYDPAGNPVIYVLLKLF